MTFSSSSCLSLVCVVSHLCKKLKKRGLFDVEFFEAATLYFRLHLKRPIDDAEATSPITPTHNARTIPELLELRQQQRVGLDQLQGQMGESAQWHIGRSFPMAFIFLS